MTTVPSVEAQPIAAFALRSGEDVLPPGYMKEGDHGQDDTGNWTLEELAFKGYVKVWDNRTGVMSYQPRWLLWQTFQMKRPDGSFIFTDKDPQIPQNYGLDMVCLLHPDSPDYPKLKQMGFKPCLKKHTPTRIALDRHMKKKHKDAYDALETQRTRTEREEDRALQMEAIRSNQALMQAMMGKLPVPVAPTTAIITSPTVTATTAVATLDTSSTHVVVVGTISSEEAPLYVSPNPKKRPGRPKRSA